ncbi:dihydropyrimidine dehydrogenase [Paenibacillus swuensis]|uniref:Dihydropyrimidine dehydrogenase n=1 Tax=Paenibacillus swuensis TaxID=1178515 RepID=A0A172TND4_9BACL|nr:NAD(P)-dependent oxidoreductase [Paenibacillus swuensis]ANE48486.1 dihydropyrimidine dehydrogenase [Paenibacillus swuensis]
MASTFISVQDLERNFREVKRVMRPKEAQEESNRCLYCYDAPCIKACPTGIDIPSFIKKIATGNLKGSARTIMDANPVGATCARVCPTEELCEGACVLNESSNPIRIGDLQRYATDWAIQSEQALFKAGEPNGKSVAVVGGGPAGLSAARELARFGFAVTLFESKEQAGGLDTYGIVSFRLPQEISLWEVEQVKALGVNIRTQVQVGRDISPSELLSAYDAVVLAVGLSAVPRLGIEGEASPDVYDAVEFIESTKGPFLRTDFTGKEVAVIGAGNTAIDAATCAVRLGAAKVKIVYRRTRQEMTAYDFEFEFAKADGVEFEWLTAPSRLVTRPDGTLAGVECVKMQAQVGHPLADDKPSLVPVEHSAFLLRADAVILAIGQTRHTAFVESWGIEHRRGTVTVNPDTMQTSDPRIYAAGDVIFGEGQGEAMVVSAAQQGKKAARAIHQLLASAKP